MQRFFFTADFADQLNNRLEATQRAIQAFHASDSGTWIDHDQITTLLYVDEATLQNWKDSGSITFFLNEQQIYYLRSDVEALLHTHQNQTFKPP
jgi:hypothetical protein